MDRIAAAVINSAQADPRVEDMSIVEAGARGGAIAVLCLLAALIWWNGRGVRGAWLAALFAAGLAATLVGYAPAVAMDHKLWLAPLRVLAFGNPAVFWALARVFFGDDARPSWPPAAAWAALLVLGFWAVYGATGPRPFLPLNLLSLVCLGLGLWPTVAGRAGDLVEARRRLRLAIVGGVGLSVGAVKRFLPTFFNRMNFILISILILSRKPPRNRHGRRRKPDKPATGRRWKRPNARDREPPPDHTLPLEDIPDRHKTCRCHGSERTRRLHP